MARNEENTIWGGPTKRFFVSMLTRDIALSDAILDLIDNCVDGATRQTKGQQKKAKPYDGYEAWLTIEKDSFEIDDNCGGIPEDRIADAFLLGRPKIDKDKNLPTIGMYGIGMKRAIFKIGEEAVVESRAGDGSFAITYDHKWLDPDNDSWELSIHTLRQAKNEKKGVTILIPWIRDEVAKHFGNKQFLNNLKATISEHFGYLMQKGFSVALNAEVLQPKTLQLYTIKSHKEVGVRPYDFVADRDGVHVRVSVGFFRPLAFEVEIEDETEKAIERDTAGISVICNDRLVLVNDTSMKTGWGDGGVPKYHPQFRGITGFISFSTNEPTKLPISTTKRDLDVGSDLFLFARRYCMEGIRECTEFTNKWKGMEAEANKYFRQAERRDARTQIDLAAKFGTPVRGTKSSKRLAARLPVPDKRNPMKRISFTRKETEVRTVSNHLFGEPDQPPSVVGQECFDRELKAARRK